jgi:peptidyl-prolyl cis-trans isomerase SurA
MSRWLALPVLLPLLLGVADAAPMIAPRRVVNRIVAIVDDVAITKREVDRRASSGRPAAEILNDLVEEELLATEADRRRIEVDRAEVDAALAEVAKQNNLTVAQIFEAAKQQGFGSEADYRAELKRQLLQLRVINSHLADEITRGGSPPTDGLEGARKRLIAELRTRAFIEVRL